MGKPVENFAKNDNNPQSFPQGKNDVFCAENTGFCGAFSQRFYKAVFKPRLKKPQLPTQKESHKRRSAAPHYDWTKTLASGRCCRL